jgi:hypothetical protein
MQHLMGGALRGVGTTRSVVIVVLTCFVIQIAAFVWIAVCTRIGANTATNMVSCSCSGNVERKAATRTTEQRLLLYLFVLYM